MERKSVAGRHEEGTSSFVTPEAHHHTTQESGAADASFNRRGVATPWVVGVSGELSVANPYMAIGAVGGMHTLFRKRDHWNHGHGDGFGISHALCLGPHLEALPVCFRRSFAIPSRPRRRRRQPPVEKVSIRLPARNQQITAGELRVIFPDDDKRKPEIMSLGDALREARSRELDLVMVASSALPPVARIADFAKVVYSLQQKQKAALKAARENKRLSIPKEIRMTSNIAENDMRIKIDQARQWLHDGHAVRVVVRFRGGRGIQPGKQMLDKALAHLTDVGEIVDPQSVERPQMNRWVVHLTAVKDSSKREVLRK